jgi:glycosyltransferase involved in cell wall biosynthesis
MSEPLVTCLCLTMAGRKEWLKRAVECYANQTYERRELLIVADSIDDVEALGPFDPGSSMSFQSEDDWMKFGVRKTSVLVSSQRLNIGAKRNIGCESAYFGPLTERSLDNLCGDDHLIAIWDDDDYSAPGRLAQQVDVLQTSGKAVTGYREMKFLRQSRAPKGAGVIEILAKTFHQWYQFKIGAGFVIGTSLMFRRSWWQSHPFEEKQVGEDAAFCHEAHEAGQLVECPDLNLMYASIHEGNVSKLHKGDPEKGYRPLPGFQWPGTDRGLVKAWEKNR